MKSFILRIALLLPVILSGCYTLNTHQSAKTLDKGNVSFQLIQGFSGIPYNEEDEFNNNSGGFMMPQIQVAYGVGEKLDLGATIGFNKLGLLGKYQFVGDQDSKFAMATGGNFYRASGGTWDFFDGNVAEVPLFISYHPFKNISLYSHPMLLFMNIEEPGIEASFNNDPFFTTGTYKGLSSGLIFDAPMEVGGVVLQTSLELSWMAPLESNRYHFFTTIGVGIKFPTKRSK